jgi:hypothetical protein
MAAMTQRAQSILGGPMRVLGLALVVVICVAVLLVSVALVSLGPSEFKSSVAAALDDMHIIGPRTQLLRAAKRYERANAAEDGRIAVSSGDSRLLPILGIGEGFPSVPPEAYADYRQRYGAKMPLYAGCVIDSAEDDRFRSAAYAYAEQ